MRKLKELFRKSCPVRVRVMTMMYSSTNSRMNNRFGLFISGVDENN